VTRAVIVCPSCGHRILPNVTARQEKILALVTKHTRVFGFAPTKVEIARALQLNESTVAKEIVRLTEQGRLSRRFRGGRNLVVVEQGSRQHERPH
jgi:DeoR/GlpR family transcriptional regulator of sugar metabolism